jgi:NAD(P)-dependent dehydrogenase (short-subunit alcohol dehydrogenase family)
MGTIALHDQVVFLTGGGRGIGAATARALVDAGASVAVLDIDGAAASAVAAPLGDRALALEGDTTDSRQLDQAVAATVGRFGGIDAVIANAGIEVLGGVGDMEPDAFQRVVDVDLVGSWRTVRATLPAVAERRGYYLMVASLAAVAHAPFNGAYSAAKAGLVALAKTMRLELAPRGIAVGIAYLTYTDTETARRAVEDPRMQALFAGLPRLRPKPMAVGRVAEAYVRALATRQRRLLFDRASVVAVHLPEFAGGIGERMMRRALTRTQATSVGEAREVESA